MTAILRLLRNYNFFKISANTSCLRHLSNTPTLNLKQIQETQNGSELLIEGVYVESPREKHMMRHAEGKCALCALGLDVKHTDVLILSQFLRSDGCVLPKRVTGLCNKQQKRISTLIAMSQKAGLMPNISPPNSKFDPSKRFGYKKYNRYFDDSTILTKPRKRY